MPERKCKEYGIRLKHKIPEHPPDAPDLSEAESGVGDFREYIGVTYLFGSPFTPYNDKPEGISRVDTDRKSGGATQIDHPQQHRGRAARSGIPPYPCRGCFRAY